MTRENRPTRALPHPLSPPLRDRVRGLLHGGWGRPVLLRRALAGALTLLALVLALHPPPGRPPDTGPVLVAARDIAPGALIQPADVAQRRAAADSAPAHALQEPAQAVGRVLAGAARAGEPLTDVRLAGPEFTELVTRRGAAAAVPVRLADPDVADLLRPGSRVDVVSLAPDRAGPAVLAADAVVVAVRPASGTPANPGRLVVVGVAREEATRVTAASLSQGVAVTLR
ncbi:SAF domain-containing protein [Streptoalloteichus hindustanus]|uniref:Flp pilus assembly protein CpaB n=1 Tax=Streptoalloteichus hindustanus TaxID=2017 RepID=A0A1M5KZI6_STRHI|nr:SAF domain-containing protein [Streptoalloteichus hindustanus]SHG57563.1 Flp pilus assembly protein CpaB [Streptoalloteichus hindustanus]